MRIAYLHALPIEYYPPAINTLRILASHPGWSVRAWSTDNARGLDEFRDDCLSVARPWSANPDDPMPVRLASHAVWNTRSAIGIAEWKPDALISVEPHSALAAWLYYKILRGSAPLLIHHHEYYSSSDFQAPGMRSLRRPGRLERSDLFPRATWISQTNPSRMRLLRERTPQITDAQARILPNYPPSKWVERARTARALRENSPLRLVYLGSASLEDTFIEQVLEWVAANPQKTTLHIVGDNVSPRVWEYADSLNAPNITTERSGIEYDKLPELLKTFDAGLVLYKGNTENFVHNVPNKAIEYLAAGLEVWYPPEMAAMQLFHRDNPSLAMREVDFRTASFPDPSDVHQARIANEFPFTAESATEQLVEHLERLDHARSSR